LHHAHHFRPCSLEVTVVRVGLDEPSITSEAAFLPPSF